MSVKKEDLLSAFKDDSGKYTEDFKQKVIADIRSGKTRIESAEGFGIPSYHAGFRKLYEKLKRDEEESVEIEPIVGGRMKESTVGRSEAKHNAEASKMSKNDIMLMCWRRLYEHLNRDLDALKIELEACRQMIEFLESHTV